MIYLFFFLILTNFILWKNINFLSLKLNLFDFPNKNLKIHDEKISIISGFFLLLNVLIIFIFSVFLNNDEIKILSDQNILIVLFAVFLLGYLDDRISLKPTIRLISFSFLFALFLYFNPTYNLQTIQIDNFQFTLSRNYSIAFTIFCFLIYLNAFNFFDGINLQAGLHTIYIYIVLLLKLDFNYEIIFFVLFYVCFLMFNGKNLVFLGNSGAYLSATILSITLIHYFKKQILTPTEIFILMSIPGLDMIRIILIRLSKMKNPFKGDLNHIHHLLKNNYGVINTNIIVIFAQIINYLFYLFFKNEILSIIFSIVIYLLLIFITKKRYEKI